MHLLLLIFFAFSCLAKVNKNLTRSCNPGGLQIISFTKVNVVIFILVLIGFRKRNFLVSLFNKTYIIFVSISIYQKKKVLMQHY